MNRKIAITVVLVLLAFAVLSPLAACTIAEKSTREEIVSESFSSLRIDCESSDVRLVSADDGVCSVTVDELKNLYFTVEVKDGTLEIIQHDKRGLLDRIGVLLADIRLTVALPAKEYSVLNIRTGSGEISSSASVSAAEAEFNSISGGITLSGFNCEALRVSCVSGAARLTDSSCGTVQLHATSGSVHMSELTARVRIAADVTSGSVRFDSIDAPEIGITSTSGSIAGTVLHPMKFDAKAISGTVNVPPNGGTGVFTAQTTSGSIDIRIAE